MVKVECSTLCSIIEIGGTQCIETLELSKFAQLFGRRLKYLCKQYLKSLWLCLQASIS